MLYTMVRFTTPEEMERFTRKALGEVLAAVPPSGDPPQIKGRRKTRKRRSPAPEAVTLHFVPKNAVARKCPKRRR